MDVSCPFLLLISFLTQWNGYIIEVCKPNNFESHKILKLSFTNIQGLCLELVWCFSWIQTNGFILKMALSKLSQNITAC